MWPAALREAWQTQFNTENFTSRTNRTYRLVQLIKHNSEHRPRFAAAKRKASCARLVSRILRFPSRSTWGLPFWYRDRRGKKDQKRIIVRTTTSSTTTATKARTSTATTATPTTTITTTLLVLPIHSSCTLIFKLDCLNANQEGNIKPELSEQNEQT